MHGEFWETLLQQLRQLLPQGLPGRAEPAAVVRRRQSTALRQRLSSSSSPSARTRGNVGQTEPHKTLGHVFTLAQKAPRLSYPLLSSLRGHPAVRQTLPGAQDCAHVTDVPKPRPSSGSGCCCCCCCCLSMTQGGTMASSSIPQVCRAPVEPSPCSRRCRLCRGSLRWPGAGPELGELGASSITPARTHRATSFLR